MVTIVRADNVSMSYGGTPILKGVSFALEAGEALSLIGSNGAGKSSLIRCLLRLEPVTSGRISLFGREIQNLKPSELRSSRCRVGVVFQRHNLVPRLSVLSNVVHGALGPNTQTFSNMITGISLWSHVTAGSAYRERAMECLDRVNLADLAHRRADSLSGGQSQRVAIARALMQEPDLIIADEPAASLDPVAGEEVMKLFSDLCREAKVGLLFSTHNISHAVDFADRIMAMNSGKISLDGPTGNVDLNGLEAEYA
nr:ATP-binding cassette domain-containing protein [Yoonia sp.]